REMMSFISEQQKALLYAVCKEGTARHITSAAFVRNHNLKSQSSVQFAIKRLLELDLITEQERQYHISDPLLRLWIQHER
ncbi:MAG: ATPase, partial [Prevotella sp.]